MESKKRTLAEDLRMIGRGIGIWQKMIPSYIPYMVFGCIIGCLVPYFPLYMSAQIVNELSGACNLQKLFMMAGATVGGTFALAVLNRFLSGKLQTVYKMAHSRREAYLFDVENTFQYEHLEDPDVVLMRKKIDAVSNATNAGMLRILDLTEEIIKRLLNVLVSAALTLSLFRVSKGTYTGFFAFANSPWAALLLVAVIAANAVLSVKLTTRSMLQITDAMADVAEMNTLQAAYMEAKGTDMYIFKLNAISLADYEKKLLRPKWIASCERATIKWRIGAAVLDVIVKMTVFLFTAAKAWIGVIGIGNFILYQGTVQRFVYALSGIAANFGELRYSNQYLEKTFEYIDMPNNMYKGTLAVEKRDDIDYEIEFRDVSFKYPRSEEWVLRHVNIKFRIGDKLAIVGENGSGKTTFIKLLCRLYDPTEGKILLNGIDITRYRYDEYMSLFSVAFQDYTLF